MQDAERRETKRKRKKENKEKTKLQLKMSLNMRQKDDLGPTDTGDKDIFRLTQIQTKAVSRGLDCELRKISPLKNSYDFVGDEKVTRAETRSARRVGRRRSRA